MLMPEVSARRVLGEQRVRFSVLAPYGSWLGCGVLRVLRVTVREDDSTELLTGYESYEPLFAKPKRDEAC
jgi:hypothetical protein